MKIGAEERDAVQLAFAFDGEVPGGKSGLRSIETDFPVLEISRLAQIESYRKNIYRSAYYLHKWWARRTGSTFRAILLAALLPDGHSPLDFFYQLHSFGEVMVLDPFMGGGTTVGEALRLGARVVGVDINPVSWFLVKKIVEPVSLRDLDAAYRTLEETVGQELSHFYETSCPTCGGSAQAVYTYWVKWVPCQGCGEPVLLRKSMILAPHMSKPNTGLVTCSQCGLPYLSTSLDHAQRCPACHTIFDVAQGFARGADYTCSFCGTHGRIVEALRGQGQPPQHRMIAIYTHCPACGKAYKKPDAQDLARYEAIKAQLDRQAKYLPYPRSPIPSGYNTQQMLNYNYRFWFQMFNERQLLGLAMLLERVLSIEDPNIREFMLLLFSGTLEFNNLFCSPKGLGTGAVRHLFAHHAFIPAKEPLEAHLWGVGGSSGGFSTLYRDRLRRGKAYARRPVERRLISNRVKKVAIPGESLESALADSFEELKTSSEKRVFLLSQSSTKLTEIPDRSIDLIITDPPYLDNVMYSELSDFFYVWLRLGLQDRYPQFKPDSARREDEAIKNLEQGKDASFYQDILMAVFQECYRVLKEEGLLVFTFHHGTGEAWDALAQALRAAGFAILRLWPVHAEMDVGVPILGKEGIKLDAILVCRKQHTFPVIGERLQDLSRLKSNVEEEVQPLLGRLTGEFVLTEADRVSLSQGIVAMWFTQERTDLLPSALFSPRE